MAATAAGEFKVVHGDPLTVEEKLNASYAEGWEVVGVSSAPYWAPIMLGVLVGTATHVTVVLKRERKPA